MEKELQRVDKCLTTCNEQLTLITETREWTECRALQGRGSCGKSSKSIFFCSFQKSKTTHTSVLVIAEGFEKVRKTKFELERKKYVDCFLDGHSNYDANLVSFKLKSL